MRVVIDISEHDKEWIGNAYGIPQEINTKIAEAIINAEPCQPEPHWIPVTERLPEGIGQAIVQTNGGAIHEAFYKGKNDYGHEVWMRLDGDIYWDDEVVAWMPLPEPYKGVKE